MLIDWWTFLGISITNCHLDLSSSMSSGICHFHLFWYSCISTLLFHFSNISIDHHYICQLFVFFYSILITVAVFITAIFYANKKAIDASLKWQRKRQSSNTWFCIIKIKMHLSDASIHLSLNKSISPTYHFIGYTKCSYTMHITFYTNSCWYFNWISFCIYYSNKWHAQRVKEMLQMVC